MPSKTKLRFQLTRLSLAAAMFVMPAMAHAQAEGPVKAAMQSIAWATGMVITVVNMITWVVFIFLTILLDPLFFSLNEGNAFVEMLNKVWMLSRDLMNIAFALILIGAAVYTIVTANKEVVTSHLKTFVLSVVLINFSWFIPRIIIDVGNIAAATIYGIPSLVSTTNNLNCKFTTTNPVPGLKCAKVVEGYVCPCGMIANAEFFLNEDSYKILKKCNDPDIDPDIKPSECSGKYNGWHCPLGSVMCVHMVELTPDVAAHSAILNGLIVNHARLQGLATLPPSSGQSSSTEMIMFVVKEAIVIFMHIALLFPLIAILLAFAIRIPVLWLTIAFMPFLFLKYVLPSQYTTEYPEKLLENFLKAAFLPALVAIPFAIGFMLVNVGNSPAIQAAVDLTKLQAVNIKLTDSISNLWELLWYLITLGVIWAGVFIVLEKAGIMGMGSQAIKGIGESIGRLAIKAPLSLPIIPGPLGNVTPLSQLKKLDPRKIEYQLDNNPKGIGQYIEDAKAGRAPGAHGTGNPLHNAQRAEELAKTTNHQLETLNDGMKALIDAYKEQDPTKRAAAVQTAIQTINTNSKLDINTTNPDQSLEEILKKIHEVHNKAGGGANTDIDTFDLHVKELKAEIAKTKTP